MLEFQKRRKSWLTQRVANRFPPWSRLRSLSQSTGQQLMEPLAKEVEDQYWQSTYNLFNRFLMACDRHQLDGLYRLALPSTFSFSTTDKPGGLVYHNPSLVKGELSNGTWVTLSAAANNSLRDFWYAVPTRITYSGESMTYRSVVPNTEASALENISPSSIGVPGKLWITLTDNSACTRRYSGQLNRATVYLTGRDVFGKELKEKVVFTYNGKISTKREWEEVETVTTEYIDDTANIRIDWLPIGHSDHLDIASLNISPEREKWRFYKLGDQSFGSTLQSLSFAADSFYSVQEGNDEKDVMHEAELLDSSGSDVSGTHMCVWPKRFWTIVTDGSYFHFFYPEPEVSDKSILVERTAECILQIETESEHAIRGDTVTLDYNLTRPFWRILRTRWSVLKPDGTRVGIAEDGSEITYSFSTWVTNDDGTKFRKLGYQGNPIDYTLNQKGQYVFYLETMIKDNLRPATYDPVLQTDVKVIDVASNTAQASLLLPVSVGEASYVAFDSYDRPWVISSTGTAYRLNFHYDYYMVDFTDRHLIVREPYDSISVTA